MFFKVFPSIMLPMFLAVVDQTIVATALPAIAASLGNVERVSWVVISYLIATTVAAPVYGQLGDAIGRRTMMLVALAIFMTSSIVCALSTSMEMLTLARIAQGLGGGGLMTLSQALVGEAVPGRERARYQGYLATVAVTSNAFGPVAGGYLTHHLGWQSIFLVNLPIGLLAVVLTLRLEPRQQSERPAWRFDFVGLVLFVVFIVAIILALDRVQRFDPRSLVMMCVFAATGVAALVALIIYEKRVPAPLLPVALFKEPSIWRSDGLAIVHGASLVSFLTFLPIYLQSVRSFTPSEAGLLMVALPVGIGIGSMVTGRLVSSTGRTTVFPIIGLSILVVAMVGFGFWSPDLGGLGLAAQFFVSGVCYGTVMAVVQVTVQTTAGRERLGQAAASVQFSRSIGAALGTAIVAAVLFGTLTAFHPDTVVLFRNLVETGPGAMAALPAASQAVAQSDIAEAFRLAFLTMAAFASVGIALAITIPVKRI